MLILGLNHGEINSSAALYKSGKIISASPEERFSRQKQTNKFPNLSIRFCLEVNHLKLRDIDYIAQSWNPGAAWVKYNPFISANRIKREDYFYSITDNLFNLVDRAPKDWVYMDFPNGSEIPPIYYVQHHRCHASNAFFLSPFEEAAICTLDYQGELECLTLAIGKENNITTLLTQNVPNSLGMFYATYTEMLGYRPDNDEWKVMALSAFNIECKDFINKIKSTFELTENGTFVLDQSYYKGALVEQPNLYTDKLIDLLEGHLYMKDKEINEWKIKVAKAMQIVSEEIASHTLEHLYKITQSKNLVVGGGFFMNSVYNGKILEKTPFNNLYISHSPSDVGNSIGAALYVAHCIKSQKRDYSFNSSYLGPSFNSRSIEKSLQKRNIKYELLDNSPKTIAELITSGEIVAHFDGKMEFGERALGNRSILADPTKEGIKDEINSIIKYRESYRPFAPAIIYEKSHEYFDVEEGYECFFMEKVVPVRLDYRHKLPAITHVDGSARLQTVKKEHNEKFYNILLEIGKISNFPIALNTSFNINGEPIVNSPDDALTTFFNSGLKYMVINDFLIQK